MTGYDHGEPRPGELAGDEVPPGVCVHIDDDTDRMCQAPARWHGISSADWSEYPACDEHRVVLTWMKDVDWIHPWVPACAGGRFVDGQNECLATP